MKEKTSLGNATAGLENVGHPGLPPLSLQTGGSQVPGLAVGGGAAGRSVQRMNQGEVRAD